MALFFEHKRPRQFEYQPRFYDPKKERLEQLKAKYGEQQGETFNRRINFRAALKEKQDEKLGSKVPISKIVVYACIVVILLYVILEFLARWQ